MNAFTGTGLLLTLATGLVAVIGAVLVYAALIDRRAWWGWRIGVRPRAVLVARVWKKEATDSKPESAAPKDVSVVAFGALALLVGLLVENTSDRLVAMDLFGMRLPLFSKEVENRTAVLLADGATASGDQEWSLTGLGTSVFDLQLYERLAGPPGERLQAILESLPVSTRGRPDLDVLDEEQLARVRSLTEACSGPIYYHSKNTVYRSPTLFSELTRIQDLIDFVRAATLISVALMLFVPLLCLLSSARVKTLLRVRIFPHAYPANDPKAKVPRAVFLATGLALAVVFFRGEFEYLERDFNKRAIGYYVSDLAETAGEREALPLEKARAGTTHRALQGVSGLVAVGPSSPGNFLAVHDTKPGDPAPRLSLIWISDAGIHREPVPILDLGDERLPADLESIARLPVDDARFLAAESSHFQGPGSGRLFEFALEADPLGTDRVLLTSARVLAVHQLPAELQPRDPEKDDESYEQIEGMTVLPRLDEPALVVFGLRRSGDLLLVPWTDEGMGVVERMTNPNGLPGFQRQVSALAFEESSGVIWATAAKDPGDQGPFGSVVYQIATRGDLTSSNWSGATSEPKAHIGGLKLEGLAVPSPASSYPLVFGSEDEDLGGTLRPLGWQ